MLVNSYTVLSHDLEGRIQSALAAMRAGVPSSCSTISTTKTKPT